jgi:hypothetical protein
MCSRFGDMLLAGLMAAIYWPMFCCGRLQRWCRTKRPSPPLSPRSQNLLDHAEAENIDLDDSLDQEEVTLDSSDGSEEAAV